MRAQIAITRNGITQASADKAPPEGGVLARRTNGDFLISLHRHVSETALVQMMRSLRALDPSFEMSLEIAGNITRNLSRQDACMRLALRALGILERVNEPLFMSNLEIYDRKRPPAGMRSQKFLRLAELDLAGKDAPTALLEVSAAAIENLVSVGQNRSMRLYFLALPEETDWPAEVPATGVRPPRKDLLIKFMTGICSVFCDNSLPVQNIPRRIHMGGQIYRVLCSDPVNQTRPQAGSGRVISGK